MSEFRVWSSILGWAAFAILAAWSTYSVLVRINPELPAVTLGLATFLAVQAAYGVRSIARRLGWARKSYAPAATVEK